MVVMLPQDPRVTQQQAFGMMGIEGIGDYFQEKENEQKEQEKRDSYIELISILRGQPENELNKLQNLTNPQSPNEGQLQQYSPEDLQAILQLLMLLQGKTI